MRVRVLTAVWQYSVQSILVRAHECVYVRSNSDMKHEFIVQTAARCNGFECVGTSSPCDCKLQVRDRLSVFLSVCVSGPSISTAVLMLVRCLL